MEVTGKILRLESIEKITEKFSKRRIIVEYAKNENYPQTLEFTLTQNNVSLANNLNPGDEIKLFFDLKGKEFVDKNGIKRIFNTLEAWKIEVVKQSPDFVSAPSTSSVNSDGADDMLPF